MTAEHLVGRIAAADLPALARWRATAGWELCPGEDASFWLRVPASDRGVFAALPLSGRWHSDVSGKLTRQGGLVPERILPEAGWGPLAGFLPVAPPVRGTVGMPPVGIALTLEQDEEILPAGSLLGRWRDFANWADEAFAPRITCLRFARCDDDRVFIAGHPLPAVRGSGFHPVGRLWLPCGYRLPEHVWPELVEELLGLGSTRLALIHPDGSHEILAEENLVAASRASVRHSEGESIFQES